MVYLSTPTSCRCNASTLLICHCPGPPSVVPGLAAAGEIPTNFCEAAACRCQQAACCQQHRGEEDVVLKRRKHGGGVRFYVVKWICCYLRILSIQVWEVFLFDFGEVFLLFFFNLDVVGGDTFLVRSEGPSLPWKILSILSLNMLGIQVLVPIPKSYYLQ